MYYNDDLYRNVENEDEVQKNAKIYLMYAELEN